jgi:NDP-sugar pyrophosphorylase family protein
MVNKKRLGDSMYPMTEEYPKHLMPISNKPLLCYVLEYLETYRATGKT